MRRYILIFVFTTICSLLHSQVVTVDNFVVNAIMENCIDFPKLPFVARELIEAYKIEPDVFNKYIPKFNKRQGKPKGMLFCNDVVFACLYDSLINLNDNINTNWINEMISKMVIHKDTIYNVDWGRVYQGCEDCPFATYFLDISSYELFALVYMSDKEIKQMIEYDNGYQWKYTTIIDILESEHMFEWSNSQHKGKREIDRRVMQFLINKWSPCQIPEVQQLVSVLKEVLPTDYNDEWYEAITGTWIGKFGDKTIELTIRANEFEINGFSKFEGQVDEKRVTFYGDNDDYQQVEGPYVRFTVTEQPTDKEWNGKFNFKLIRNTDKLEGTWISNNKKIKREFVLERFDK